MSVLYIRPLCCNPSSLEAVVPLGLGCLHCSREGGEVPVSLQPKREPRPAPWRTSPPGAQAGPQRGQISLGASAPRRAAASRRARFGAAAAPPHLAQRSTDIAPKISQALNANITTARPVLGLAHPGAAVWPPPRPVPSPLRLRLLPAVESGTPFRSVHDFPSPWAVVGRTYGWRP